MYQFAEGNVPGMSRNMYPKGANLQFGSMGPHTPRLSKVNILKDKTTCVNHILGTVITHRDKFATIHEHNGYLLYVV